MADHGQVKLKLDLHDIYNRDDDLERALHAIMEEAKAKKAPLVEIIPGKGSGQLKKRSSFPQAQGHQAAVSLRGKGRRQLRAGVVLFRWK